MGMNNIDVDAGPSRIESEPLLRNARKDCPGEITYGVAPPAQKGGRSVRFDIHGDNDGNKKGININISIGNKKNSNSNNTNDNNNNNNNNVENGGEGRDDGELTVTRTPLPYKEVMLLALLRMASPIAWSQIFPYINQMMEDLKVTDKTTKVGYYSGLIDSVFSFVQLFTCLRVGMLSDRMGRKPLLLIGLYGVVICTFLFGLSKSFAWALMTRAIAGAVSGNAMIINSAIADITDETNQAQAYTITGLAYNVASILGPVIGGTFAKPAETFPNSFGKIQLFVEYPYLLPCSVSDTVSISALIACTFFFKETAVRRPVLKQVESFYSSNDIQKIDVSKEKKSVWKIARHPVLSSILITHFALNFLTTTSMVVFTLFAYTPIAEGGLSRNPDEIGFATASSGIISSILEVILIPKLQRRFGTRKLYIWSMSLWPIIFLSFPLLHTVATSMAVLPGGGSTGPVRTGGLGMLGVSSSGDLAVWISISLQLTIQRIATMAYPLILILTKDAAPSDDVLGTVFGLSQLVGATARTVGPAFISSLFALSKQHQIAGGNFVWVIMAVLSTAGFWSASRVKDGTTAVPYEPVPDEEEQGHVQGHEQEQGQGQEQEREHEHEQENRRNH